MGWKKLTFYSVINILVKICRLLEVCSNSFNIDSQNILKFWPAKQNAYVETGTAINYLQSTHSI